jgi:hypothetical protein
MYSYSGRWSKLWIDAYLTFLQDKKKRKAKQSFKRIGFMHILEIPDSSSSSSENAENKENKEGEKKE